MQRPRAVFQRPSLRLILAGVCRCWQKGIGFSLGACGHEDLADGTARREAIECRIQIIKTKMVAH